MANHGEKLNNLGGFMKKIKVYSDMKQIILMRELNTMGIFKEKNNMYGYSKSNEFRAQLFKQLYGRQ